MNILKSQRILDKEYFKLLKKWAIYMLWQLLIKTINSILSNLIGARVS